MPTFRNRDDQLNWESCDLHNVHQLPASLAGLNIGIDVGAHVGGFSWACLERGIGRMVAVEPSKENCDLLRTNLDLYRNNLTVIEAGLWGNSEPAPQFWARDDHGRAAHGVGSLRWQEGIPITIQRLDPLLVSLENVDLMKIDTEGAELDILGDSKELHRIQSIYGEFHLWRYTLSQLTDVLLAAGFAVRSEFWRTDLGLGGFWATRG